MNAVNRSLSSPLHVASENNKVEMIDLLVSQGKLEDAQKRISEEQERRHEIESMNSGLKKELGEAREESARMSMEVEELNRQLQFEQNLQTEVKRLRAVIEQNEQLQMVKRQGDLSVR